MTEPFSSFMRRALYDPGRGYYTARIRTVGARGDFSTSATLSSLLGKAVASWLRREAGETAVRTIIEIGGGDGSLMAAVTAALGWWGRLGLQFRMVEASPLLAARQRARLGGRIKAWHATLPEALAASGGRALLFHNELLDAFPVDLVQGDGHAWQEVWLRHEAGGVREELRPQSADIPSYSVLQSGLRGRCELHSGVRAWFHEWLPAWKRGSMLAVDYGDLFPALYQRRPQGTLRAYLMHQRLTGSDVYLNPGRQDITCDINFTDIRAWLAAAGLHETGYETQAAFVRRWADADGDLATTGEGGAGDAFKCLTVRRI